jgi:hypothetical protein
LPCIGTRIGTRVVVLGGLLLCRHIYYALPQFLVRMPGRDPVGYVAALWELGKPDHRNARGVTLAATDFGFGSIFSSSVIIGRDNDAAPLHV